MIIQEKQQRIIRGDDFLINLSKFTNKKDVNEFITEKKHSIKENKDASYRIINYWTEIGLIDDSRDRKSKWRRFSILDMVWHRVILSLRNFGLPNEKILKIKSELLDRKAPTGAHYPLFEYYSALALFYKKPVYIMVFKDGSTEIADSDELGASEKIGFLNEDHIKINLNRIIERMFTKSSLKPIYDLAMPLSEEELKILQSIRSGNFQRIQVRLEDGKPFLLEETEIKDAEEKIIEVLRNRDNKYSSIEIKQKNGRIVFFRLTSQKKL